MDDHDLEEVSRPELERHCLEMRRFCEALQQRLRETTEANRILRYKYSAAKSEIADLLWNRLVQPGRLVGVPPLDETAAEGEDVLGRYAVGATLGLGSSAVVKECRREATDERFAIKIVDKARVVRYKALWRLCNEVVNMRAVDHPNVVRLVDAVHTQTRFCLVLQHGGRDLYGYITATYPDLVAPEPAARLILSQLVAGCCALSAKNIVHHDIKSENVLVVPGAEDAQGSAPIAAVRVTDLGMSEAYDRGARGTAFCGSPGFFPPEMVLARDYDPFKVDAPGQHTDASNVPPPQYECSARMRS